MTGRKFTRILLVLGVLLILGALLITVVPVVSGKIASSKNDGVLETVYSLIPEVRSGTFDDRVDVDMPSLEVDGEDYVGIIEIPMLEVHLPIRARWDSGKVSRSPCRFAGSIYDGSLIVGGSDHEDQFDFAKTISIGDAVFVTDMTGSRYTYKVTWVELTDDVSAENLASREADLVLFVRDSYSLEYAVITCDRH